MGSTTKRSGRGDWNYSEPDNTALFRNLLFSTFQADICLVVGSRKEEIPAHKLILNLRSEHFQTLIKDLKGATRLEIPDVDPAHFKRLLKYIYTGNSSATGSQALPLLRLALEFKVPGLVNECSDKLVEDLSVNQAIELFQFGMEFGNKRLTDECLDYLCRNAERVLQHFDAFSSLRLDCLIELIQRDEFYVKNEVDVFEAVYEWGQAECRRQGLDDGDNESLKMILQKPLRHVRFPLMDKEEFVFKVATRNILAVDDLIAIQMYFLVSEPKRSSIPGGRFTSTRRSPKMTTGTILICRQPGTDDLANWTAVDIGNTETLMFRIHHAGQVRLKRILFQIPETYGREVIADVGFEAVSGHLYPQEQERFQQIYYSQLQLLDQTGEYCQGVDWVISGKRWYRLVVTMKKTVKRFLLDGNDSGFRARSGYLSDGKALVVREGQDKTVRLQVDLRRETELESLASGFIHQIEADLL